MAERDWSGFTSWLREEAATGGVGRASLRRRWVNLRALAQTILPQLERAEVVRLLGKEPEALDPEENDLKAVVAYGAGKGLVDRARLATALRKDNVADPLAFLAGISGKSFGESWAPRIANYWLFEPGDRWEKRSGREFFDVGWAPRELENRLIRIELKASSEAPAFRFQQIRHPRLSACGELDYDILLCLGVTAGSLEWWVLRTQDLDDMADNGRTRADRVVVTKHHGKRRPIWSEKAGYADEGWFAADERVREILRPFWCQSEGLRSTVIEAASKLAT
jgi:hypothetical protein